MKTQKIVIWKVTEEVGWRRINWPKIM